MAIWVTPALASRSQGNDLGDVSPFQRMLPSCDPALAWESAQDRLRLSLPSRAVASGQGLPSRQLGRRLWPRPCASAPQSLVAVGPKEGPREHKQPMPPCLHVLVRNKSKINYFFCLLLAPPKNGFIFLSQVSSFPCYNCLFCSPSNCP